MSYQRLGVRHLARAVAVLSAACLAVPATAPAAHGSEGRSSVRVWVHGAEAGVQPTIASSVSVTGIVGGVSIDPTSCASSGDPVAVVSGRVSGTITCGEAGVTVGTRVDPAGGGVTAQLAMKVGPNMTVLLCVVAFDPLSGTWYLDCFGWL